MTKRPCTAKKASGAPCPRSALDGQDTCKAHIPGYVRAPRAAKRVTSADIAKRPPTNSLGEPWVEGQTWTCTGCGATGPDRDDVRMPASCECIAPMQYAPPEHHAAIRAREARAYPPPPASTLDERSWRTRWNPRWLAFCEAEELEPECTMVARAAEEAGDDVAERAAAINARFMAWIGHRWADWCAAQTPPLRERPPLTDEVQQAFDRWLDAWVERVQQEPERVARYERQTDVDATCPAASIENHPDPTERVFEHMRQLREWEKHALKHQDVPPHQFEAFARPIRGHIVRATVALLEWLNEPAESAMGCAVPGSYQESIVATSEADHGAALPTTEPDRLDPAEGVEAMDTTPTINSAPTPAPLDHTEAPQEDQPIREDGRAAPEARTFHITQADCIEWLRSLDDESVDLIITDPAYESLEKHRAVGTTTRLTAAWFEIFPNARFTEFFAECFRVLKRDAHLYVYSDQETAFVTKPMAEAAGFKWWKHLVWEKTRATARPDEDDAGPAAGMGYHYRAAHELIGFYEKGKRRLVDLGICDVLRAPRVKGYPTEKPTSVSRTLIEQSSSPGELVVDPFMGSASVGEAALVSGRRFAGCDVARGSLALARDRLGRLGVEGDAPRARRQRSLFG